MEQKWTSCTTLLPSHLAKEEQVLGWWSTARKCKDLVEDCVLRNDTSSCSSLGKHICCSQGKRRGVVGEIGEASPCNLLQTDSPHPFPSSYSWCLKDYTKWKEPDSKAVYYMISYIWHPGKGSTLGTEIGSMVARDEGKGQEKGLIYRGMKEFGGMMKIFYTLMVVVLAVQVCHSKLTDLHSYREWILIYAINLGEIKIGPETFLNRYISHTQFWRIYLHLLLKEQFFSELEQKD